MSERCVVRVKFTPASTMREVRSAVGGFLRYVQHRDSHPDSPTRSDVAGMLKYVAYRERANARAELFGPSGPIGTDERKAFAEFVARSLENSKPQSFRTRDGRVMDRRRAVSRFVISPERADGLDLAALTRAAMARLEDQLAVTNLRWIAAIHRNTRHHHVHLVVAGMVEDGSGVCRRADITKARLAAIKQAVGLEIERQRGEREPLPETPSRLSENRTSAAPISGPARRTPANGMRIRALPPVHITLPNAVSPGNRVRAMRTPSSLLALRSVARRYQLQMEREAEEQARRLGWERAA